MPHSPPELLVKAPAVPGFHGEVAMVGGIRIHYWIGGEPSGSPVLLWHGFLGTGYMWRHVMTALAEAGFAVLVPDMRGYGDSDKPPGTKGFDYTPEAMQTGSMWWWLLPLAPGALSPWEAKKRKGQRSPKWSHWWPKP